MCAAVQLMPARAVGCGSVCGALTSRIRPDIVDQSLVFVALLCVQSVCAWPCSTLAQIFVAIIMAVLPTVRGHHRGIMRLVWSAQGGSESSFSCLSGSTQVTRLELDRACHPPTPPCIQIQGRRGSSWRGGIVPRTLGTDSPPPQVQEELPSHVAQSSPRVP